jgi:hypothetical protein
MRKQQKLSLSKETLRRLTNQGLEQIRGGVAMPNTYTRLPPPDGGSYGCPPPEPPGQTNVLSICIPFN